MNIFFSSPNPVECAEYLDDVRVNKMATETAQMLSTALICKGLACTKVQVDTKRVKGKDKPVYHYYLADGSRIFGSSHQNHPSNVWARASRANFNWLVQHGIALCQEYSKRRAAGPKEHASLAIIQNAAKYADLFDDADQTPFTNCAAKQESGISYKHLDDVHQAYQLYLADRWETDKKTPTWYGVGR